MGFVNKKLPAHQTGSSASKRPKEEENKNKLHAFMLLQEFTALLGRIHAENNNDRQENDRWQNSFHILSISMLK